MVSEDGLHLTCLSIPSTRHGAQPMVTELSWYRDEGEGKFRSWTLGPDSWYLCPPRVPVQGGEGRDGTCGEPSSPGLPKDWSCRESREDCLRRGGETSECPGGSPRAGVGWGEHIQTSYRYWGTQIMAKGPLAHFLIHDLSRSLLNKHFSQPPL